MSKKRKNITKFTFSNLLTIGRFILVPFIVFAIIQNRWQMAVSIFLIAAITDLFDGALARLFNERTRLGASLDPLADKILIISAYTALLLSGIPRYMLPLWFIIIIAIKELILVIGAAYLMLWSKKRIGSILQIKASWTGKGAMLTQTIYLFILLLSLAAQYKLALSWVIFLQQLVLIFVIASLIQYSYLAIKNSFAFSKKIFIFFLIINNFYFFNQLKGSFTQAIKRKNNFRSFSQLKDSFSQTIKYKNNFRGFNQLKSFSSQNIKYENSFRFFNQLKSSFETFKNDNNFYFSSKLKQIIKENKELKMS